MKKDKVQLVMERAREAVLQSGLSHRQIGNRMGLPRQSVGQFLKSREPSVRMLMRLADALEIDVRELL